MTGRRLIVVAVIVAVVLVGVRLSITSVHPGGYRVIDDYNIALMMAGAHPTWREVTSVDETSSTVTVGVSEIYLQFGPGFDDTISYEVVRLSQPLAGRQVVDASDGAVLPLWAH